MGTAVGDGNLQHLSYLVWFQSWGRRLQKTPIATLHCSCRVFWGFFSLRCDHLLLLKPCFLLLWESRRLFYIRACVVRPNFTFIQTFIIVTHTCKCSPPQRCRRYLAQQALLFLQLHPYNANQWNASGAVSTWLTVLFSLSVMSWEV